MQPTYWTGFLESERIAAGDEFSIPECDDLSGVGADIEILSEESSRTEAEELYPGIRVFQDGFIPVGGCSIGTGDPYFISINDGVGGPLCRIYHDEVSEEGYDQEAAIAVVLADYRELIRFKEDKE